MTIQVVDFTSLRRGLLAVCLVGSSLLSFVGIAAAQGSFGTVRAVAASSDSEEMRQEVLDLQRAVVDLQRALDSVLTCADRGMLYSRASTGCIVVPSKP